MSGEGMYGNLMSYNNAMEKLDRRMDYGMDNGIDNNYLADRIKVQSPLNPGGVLIPAVVAAGAFMAGKKHGSIPGVDDTAYKEYITHEGFMPYEQYLKEVVPPDNNYSKKVNFLGPMASANAGYDANLPSNSYMGKDFLYGISPEASPVLAVQDDAYFNRIASSGDDRDRVINNNNARADYGGALSDYFMNPIDNSTMYTNPVDESVFDFNKPTTIENVPSFIESNIVNPTKSIFSEYIESFKRGLEAKK